MRLPPTVVFFLLSLSISACRNLTRASLPRLEKTKCMFSRHKSLPLNWDRVAKSFLESSPESSSYIVGGPPIVVECRLYNDKCAAVWDEIGNDTRVVLVQGCYGQSSVMCPARDICLSHEVRKGDGTEEIRGKKVISTSPSPSAPSVTRFFCCCEDDLCNLDNKLIFNGTKMADMEEEDGVKAPLSPPPFPWPIIVQIIIGIMAFLLILGLFIYYRCLMNRRVRDEDNEMLIMYNATQPDGTQIRPVDEYQLGELIGRGFFSNVHRGTVRRELTEETLSLPPLPVAIKVFLAHSETHFRSEVLMWRKLQRTPPHPHMLKYITSGECTNSDGLKEFRLVCELHVHGALLPYLRANPLSWRSYFGFACSITSAINFLHTERFDEKGEVIKQPIAHRDINSVNVFVRDPLKGDCVVGDMGLALSYPYGVKQSEVKIPEIGTTRYMAPELLEGSLNLADPMTSLCQADVYSTGLLLWEMFYRCEPVWAASGKPVPPYLGPYMELTGSPPNISAMLDIVVHRNIRPDFPPACLDESLDLNDPLSRIRAFIEDMWEKEPEGRATIACSYERMRQLAIDQGYPFHPDPL